MFIYVVYVRDMEFNDFSHCNTICTFVFLGNICTHKDTFDKYIYPHLFSLIKTQ